MRKERFSNSTTLTLNGTINSIQTSLVLDGASDLPTANGDYRINIADEIMTITAFSGNTCTVVRGVDGTSGAAHSDSANAIVLATANGLRQALTDAAGPLAPANEPTHRIYGYTANSFTGYQLGTEDALTDETWGGLKVVAESWVAARMRTRVITAPSTPWTATLQMQGPTALRHGDVNADHFGISIYESATNRHTTLAYRGNYDYGVFSWTGWIWQSTPLSISCHICPYGGMWYKVHNDGTDIEYWISHDGVNWFSLGTLAIATYFTTAPDEVGFYVTNMNYNHEPSWQVKHFLVE
jgi:hypothetical protein